MTGWTLKGQWLNLLIFSAGLLAVGADKLDTWAAIPAAITPKAVLGFIVAVGGYLRSINTERPRGSFRERTGERDAKIPPDRNPMPETAPLFKEN